MKYYISHLIIALIISLFIWVIPNGALLSGGVFYISREIVEYFKYKTPFDLKGLLWPLCGTVLLWIIVNIILNYT